MEEENIYKQAPTFLYNLEGDSKLFRTQEEVDTAWENGWYGPPWALRGKPPISKMEFDTKKLLGEAVDLDPRYDGLVLNLKKSVSDLNAVITAFEIEEGIVAAIEDEGDE